MNDSLNLELSNTSFNHQFHYFWKLNTSTKAREIQSPLGFKNSKTFKSMDEQAYAIYHLFPRKESQNENLSPLKKMHHFEHKVQVLVAIPFIGLLIGAITLIIYAIKRQLSLHALDQLFNQFVTNDPVKKNKLMEYYRDHPELFSSLNHQAILPQLVKELTQEFGYQDINAFADKLNVRISHDYSLEQHLDDHLAHAKMHLAEIAWYTHGIARTTLGILPGVKPIIRLIQKQIIEKEDDAFIKRQLRS